jgi:hypothetical protein
VPTAAGRRPEARPLGPWRRLLGADALEPPRNWGLPSIRTSADDVLVMPKISAKDLAEHVRQLEKSSVEELDELLTDLLVQVYPTKVTQDS